MRLIRRLLCKHEYVWVRNIYGDEINHAGGNRSWWRCRKCGTWVLGARLHEEGRMFYGENLGTSTLARNLRDLAAEIYYEMDDGKPWEELREKAKSLMEGSIVLWETMADDAG